MTATILERVGGAPAVTAVVQEFYDRIFHDPVLLARFDGINLSRLKRHQVEFLTVALGGEGSFDGDLAATHHKLHITTDEFERVADHLAATLVHLGVEKNIMNEILAVVMSTMPQIVNEQ